MELRDKIAGALYGMALGDAMGMPAELWGRERARKFFGGKITEFIDGPKENDVAFNYNKAQFTDDTGQAMVLLDSLKATGYEPNASDIAKRMLEWAEKENAFENNILGPTSKGCTGEFPRWSRCKCDNEQSFIQWKFYENCTNRLPLYTRSEKRTDRLCVRSFQGNTYK